ncbi:hypothetical protein GALMADRAFT_352748 [Galerina marginata CBS 339.88]|uniref:WW domain-containing protein n=1 Tax=Galerina marginata (strain CBS 339.88) TaxID=685588 RepID=A0A067TSP3_GALM3|nr:hypothetical protein GALMADRAFT_352748 [Galerina marginata CBS 339.88]
MTSNAPLPHGWIQQTDTESGQPFYVDTKANPPRSIWTHPYEDQEYLREHPNIKEKVRGSNSFGSDASLAHRMPEQGRRHSFNGKSTTPVGVPPPPHKKGFLGKLVDKMEKHNEKKKQKSAIMLEQQRQWQQQRQQQMNSQALYGPPPNAYQPSYGGMAGRRGGMGGGMGMGGMGMGLPLMGGMAGGLLLGEAMNNDFGNNNNGDWGGGNGGDWGGDGGGGDWGGGGF